MSARWKLLHAALAAGVLFTSGEGQAQRSPGATQDRYLVLLDRPLRPREVLPVVITRRFSLFPALAIRADARALAALARHPRVLVIEPDEGGRGHLLQAQALIGLDSVRTSGIRGAGVTVAVVDSGIDTSHPDLAGTVVAEACFCGSGCCPGGESGPGSAPDDNGHGTHVASVIASQGQVADEGGAPDVSIVAVKVLDSDLSFGGTSNVVAALEWIAMHHPEVRVVNLSLGTDALYTGDCYVPNTVLGGAIDALRNNGALVVASSGNDGSSTSMSAPACIANATSVGAVWDADVGAQNVLCSDPITAPDRIACFSNASPITDLLAPGGLIHASWRGSGVVARAGTSQAAPMVSACAAALLAAKPEATVDELEAALKDTGTPLLDARNGTTYPRVDCAAALAAITSDAGTPDAAVPDDATVPDEDAGTDDAGLADAGPGLDAGTMAGAGSGGQAGAPSLDSGSAHEAGADSAAPDAGVRYDAGNGQAGAGARDAGRSVGDAAAATRAAATGCSCNAPGRAAAAPDTRLGWLSALALLGLRRRRGA